MGRGDWFPTYSGVQFFIEDPRIEDIRAEDIAHSLSRQCRYAGHIKDFYSVAQHSVIVSQNVPQEIALCGLLHDAAEAYCQDLIRPIKRLAGMERYTEIEHNIEQLIATRFRLPFPWPHEIKEADNRALMTERRDLYSIGVGEKFDWKCKSEPYPEKIVPVSFDQSKDLFSVRFFNLTNYWPSAFDNDCKSK